MLTLTSNSAGHARMKIYGIYVYYPARAGESARAVTGRLCPQSGKGEDFLTG